MSAAAAWMEPLAAGLQSTDFSLMGAGVTRAEWVAALLGLAMVACNLRLHPLGWVLSVASSVLYALVFLQAQLYGQLGLQALFIGMALWGLWQWLRPGVAAQPPVPLSPMSRRLVILAWLLLIVPIGSGLSQTLDSAMPWIDAVPTAGSLVATVLLVRRHPENWLMWAAVNVLSVGLFALQGLWPTVLLYSVMAGLSLWGWRVWTQPAA